MNIWNDLFEMAYNHFQGQFRPNQRYPMQQQTRFPRAFGNSLIPNPPRNSVRQFRPPFNQNRFSTPPRQRFQGGPIGQQSTNRFKYEKSKNDPSSNTLTQRDINEEEISRLVDSKPKYETRSENVSQLHDSAASESENADIFISPSQNVSENVFDKSEMENLNDDMEIDEDTEDAGNIDMYDVTLQNEESDGLSDLKDKNSYNEQEIDPQYHQKTDSEQDTCFQYPQKADRDNLYSEKENHSPMPEQNSGSESSIKPANQQNTSMNKDKATKEEAEEEEEEDSDDEDTGYCIHCKMEFSNPDAYWKHTRGLLHTQKLMEAEKAEKGLHDPDPPQTVSEEPAVSSYKPRRGELVTAAAIRQNHYNEPDPSSVYHSFPGNEKIQTQYKSDSFGNKTELYSSYKGFDDNDEGNDAEFDYDQEATKQENWLDDESAKIEKVPASQRDYAPSDFGKTQFPNEFHCKLCDVKCTGCVTYKMHLEGRQHKQNLASEHQKEESYLMKTKMTLPGMGKCIPVNKEPKIYKLIEACESPVIGLQYVTEYLKGDEKATAKYVCNLCEAKCDGATIIPHSIGIKHRLAYFKEHHPSIHSHLMQYTSGRKKTEQNASAEMFARDVERIEGHGEVKVKLEIDASTEKAAINLIKSAAVQIPELLSFTEKDDNDVKSIPDSTISKGSNKSKIQETSEWVQSNFEDESYYAESENQYTDYSYGGQSLLGGRGNMSRNQTATGRGRGNVSGKEIKMVRGRGRNTIDEEYYGEDYYGEESFEGEYGHGDYGQGYGHQNYGGRLMRGAKRIGKHGLSSQYNEGEDEWNYGSGKNIRPGPGRGRGYRNMSYQDEYYGNEDYGEEYNEQWEPPQKVQRRNWQGDQWEDESNSQGSLGSRGRRENSKEKTSSSAMSMMAGMFDSKDQELFLQFLQFKKMMESMESGGNVGGGDSGDKASSDISKRSSQQFGIQQSRSKGYTDPNQDEPSVQTFDYGHKSVGIHDSPKDYPHTAKQDMAPVPSVDTALPPSGNPKNQQPITSHVNPSIVNQKSLESSRVQDSASSQPKTSASTAKDPVSIVQDKPDGGQSQITDMLSSLSSSLICTEEEAEMALQVSNALTQALLQFRLKKLPDELKGGAPAKDQQAQVVSSHTSKQTVSEQKTKPPSRQPQTVSLSKPPVSVPQQRTVTTQSSSPSSKGPQDIQQLLKTINPADLQKVLSTAQGQAVSKKPAGPDIQNLLNTINPADLQKALSAVQNQPVVSNQQSSAPGVSVAPLKGPDIQNLLKNINPADLQKASAVLQNQKGMIATSAAQTTTVTALSGQAMSHQMFYNYPTEMSDILKSKTKSKKTAEPKSSAHSQAVSQQPLMNPQQVMTTQQSMMPQQQLMTSQQHMMMPEQQLMTSQQQMMMSQQQQMMSHQMQPSQQMQPNQHPMMVQHPQYGFQPSMAAQYGWNPSVQSMQGQPRMMSGVQPPISMPPAPPLPPALPSGLQQSKPPPPPSSQKY